MRFLITLFIAILIPTVITTVFIRKTKAKLSPFFVGMLTFFVFANILEGFFHQFFLLSGSSVANFIISHPLAYGLYGGLAAGIFEECGRFIAFKTLLKKHDAPETAISYGLGHGGIEVILTLVVTYALLAVISFTGDSLKSVLPESYFAAAQGTGIVTCCIALIERGFAMSFHIGASILVFTAARDHKKLYLFPLAILLHAVLDFPAALCQSGVISLLACEAFVGVYSIVVLIFALRLYKKLK